MTRAVPLVVAAMWLWLAAYAAHLHLRYMLSLSLAVAGVFLIAFALMVRRRD